jgi:hypothetical protein
MLIDTARILGTRRPQTPFSPMVKCQLPMIYLPVRFRWLAIREDPVHMREQAGEQTEVSSGQSDAGRDDLRRWKGTGRDMPAGPSFYISLPSNGDRLGMDIQTPKT